MKMVKLSILLSLLGLELIDLQSKPQDTSCLPALKVSDIEPKIPFTVLETTFAGWCNQYFVLSRTTVLDCYSATSTTIALLPS